MADSITPLRPSNPISNNNDIRRVHSKLGPLEEVHSLLEVCRSSGSLETPEHRALADVLLMAQNILFKKSIRPLQKKLDKLQGGEA